MSKFGIKIKPPKEIIFFSIVNIVVIQREGPQMRGGIVIKRQA